ncbi:MAG TPA: 4-hydroxy-tetrahydrodipicolinate synthase [Flavipsychrobacter sp.]|nr:4-hydroxy-tetrahydrodipicolinate synthase [Flavipsychrobacter sp.]
MPHIFKGTGVALVTPFASDQTVDFPALERLIDHVIDNGVNYLVALGTTAETPTLSSEEKKNILAFIIEKAAGRIPVVCGMGGNNTSDILAQLSEYDLTKVAGILSVVPYYNKPSQEGIYQHFKAIVTATDKPVILYNVPGRTVTNILPATALRLANEFKNVVAIKEASGVFSQCMDLVQGKPEHFAILSGDDDLVVPQIAIGFEGVISVAANCYTRDFTNMVNYALNGDFESAKNLHYELLEKTRLLFAEGNPTGVKYVLSKMGVCQNVLRLPLIPASDELASKLDKAMA